MLGVMNLCSAQNRAKETGVLSIICLVPAKVPASFALQVKRYKKVKADDWCVLCEIFQGHHGSYQYHITVMNEHFGSYMSKRSKWFICT